MSTLPLSVGAHGPPRQSWGHSGVWCIPSSGCGRGRSPPAAAWASAVTAAEHEHVAGLSGRGGCRASPFICSPLPWSILHPSQLFPSWPCHWHRLGSFPSGLLAGLSEGDWSTERKENQDALSLLPSCSGTISPVISASLRLPAGFQFSPHHPSIPVAVTEPCQPYGPFTCPHICGRCLH